MHVNGTDQDIRTVFNNCIQDDLGWDGQIPLFQLLRKLVDSFDGDVNHFRVMFDS